MRKFAIGDIHGCLEKLEDLLIKIKPRHDDLLIFLGDYIDRGENSSGVIDCLIRLKDFCSCIFLKGNHEHMLIELIEFGTNKSMFMSNGGDMTLLSYTGKKNTKIKDLLNVLPKEHKEFLTSLRWYYEDDKYIYVHAGIKKDIPMHSQDPMDMIWMRNDFYGYPTNREKKVIFAHCPFIEPFVKDDKIGIDTGAVYGRYLTAVELPDETFVHSFTLLQ